MTPTNAAPQASKDSGLGLRSLTVSGYNVGMPDGPHVPRWVAPLLALVALFLVPWTLWLTFSLPSRHVTDRYDLAWVGFDVVLAVAFAATAGAAVTRSRRLAVFAAVTGTMLVCDAWFDIVTSHTGSEMLEAVVEAVFGELPLAAICGYIVYDAERFQQSVQWMRRPTPAARRAVLRAIAADARAEQREARARRDRRA